MSYYDTSLDRRLKELSEGLTSSDIDVTIQRFDDDLNTISDLATQGLVVRESSLVYHTREIQAGSSDITVSNGDGVDGNPTIDLDLSTINPQLDHSLLLNLSADDHTQYLLVDGTRALSGDWDAGSFEIRAQTFESDVATGTAPLVIASTTKVTNLNADLLDDQTGSYYLDLANATGILTLDKGGTGASLAASAGGIFYSGAAAGAILSGTATANKMLLSGATAAPTWSTSTIPTSAGATANKYLKSDGTNYVLSTATISDTPSTAGKVLVSDGTNWITSTPTFPNASATAGKFIRSDGTNWIASTPTLPTSAGTSGKVLMSDGTNYVESTPTYPSTSGTSGKVLISNGTNNVYSTPTFPNASATSLKYIRSDGTNWIASTSTFPDSYAQGDVLYGSASNVISALAKDANATRYLANTGASNNPAWAQVNLANGVTGDLPFANLTQGSALSVLGVTGNATADVASIAAGSDHQVLRRSGTALTFGAVNLAQSAAVTGTLPVGNGGTGTTTGNITFTSALTKYFSIPGRCFHSYPTNGKNFGVVGSGVHWFPVTTANLTAPVHLPNGATITGYHGYCYDNNNPGTCTITLTKSDLDTAIDTNIGTPQVSSTTGTPGIVTLGETGLTEVVDNSTYAYYIAFAPSAVNTVDLSLLNARITYTVAGTASMS